MDLAIEANRNSALFNTMQQVLDVYNPLLHKARPTTVNQTKHRIRVNPTRWGNTFDSWNGRRTVRFDFPRIGSLVDATVKVAFQIPGDAPTDAERNTRGDRGYAKSSLTTGGLVNDLTTSNTARGRLDRIYADRLLGFNMISTYVISSKSRQIFRGTGEYLLLRFSQMDSDMKEAVFRSVTPVDIMSDSTEDMFYAPYITYQMAVPLFMFFNEHITNALDVNFSEEVHMDIELRSPSELFYYGNLGDLARVPNLLAAEQPGYFQMDSNGLKGTDGGQVTWDQSTIQGSTNHAGATVSRQQVNNTGACSAEGNQTGFGTANLANNLDDDDNMDADDKAVTSTQSQALTLSQKRHIQGIGAPWDSPANVTKPADGNPAYGFVGNTTYWASAGYVHGGTTFRYPDVDNNGESIQIMFELNADYIIQDTDAYRALRAQQFPEGTGLTTIVYDVAQETFSNLMASSTLANNILDKQSGGTFTDPDQSASGITIGDSTRFVDLQLRVNNLVQATHFMVRKHSDMGGSGSTTASNAVDYGKTIASANKKLGSHHLYEMFTRTLFPNTGSRPCYL